MVIHTGLAAKFLREAREKIKGRGWAGYESELDDSRMHWLDLDDPRIHIPGKPPLSGIDAIREAMLGYEKLCNSGYTGPVRKGLNRNDRWYAIRTSTLDAYNLAKTYFISALHEVARQKKDSQLNDVGYQPTGYMKGPGEMGLKEEDILTAFDLAYHSLKLQVRSLPQVCTNLPNGLEEYKITIGELGLKCDQLDKNEYESWKARKSGEAPKTRKITVTHEDEEEETTPEQS